MVGSLPNLNVGNMAENFAEVESSLSNETRSLPDLNYGEKVQVQDQRGTNQKWWKGLEKNVERFDFGNYLVKVDGGGNLAQVNRRFLTLADKEEFYTLSGGSKKTNGGDKRNGGDGRVEDGQKGGDRGWRRYYW